VDICHSRFDVVLMNPPFGDPTSNIEDVLARSYPSWNTNLLCAFLQMGWERLEKNGAVGAIYDRTAIVKTTYEDFRRSVLLKETRIATLADLGWEVLDANVEVTTTVLRQRPLSPSVFFDGASGYCNLWIVPNSGVCA
jgi:hypothetical protein